MSQIPVYQVYQKLRTYTGTETLVFASTIHEDNDEAAKLYMSSHVLPDFIERCCIHGGNINDLVLIKDYDEILYWE